MPNCRTFPGGTQNDRLVTENNYAPGDKFSIFFWCNIAAIDATARRLWAWFDPDDSTIGPGRMDIFLSGSNLYEIIFARSTTAGTWTVAAPSTAAWHSVLITYDAGSAANNPLVYIDAVSVAVTNTVAPAGVWDTTSSGPSRICFGARQATWNRETNGSLASWAAWGRILGQTEATFLNGGGAPCALYGGDPQNPTGLLCYVPLDAGQNPEPELVKNAFVYPFGSTVGTGPAAMTNARCARIIQDSGDFPKILPPGLGVL